MTTRAPACSANNDYTLTDFFKCVSRINRCSKVTAGSHCFAPWYGKLPHSEKQIEIFTTQISEMVSPLIVIVKASIKTITTHMFPIALFFQMIRQNHVQSFAVVNVKWFHASFLEMNYTIPCLSTFLWILSYILTRRRTWTTFWLRAFNFWHFFQKVKSCLVVKMWTTKLNNCCDEFWSNCS